jgi:hypothetical protein
MLNINIDHLNTLVGAQLSSVIFVQDYLQLDFDGSKMTCYNFPKIKLGETIYHFGETEYRNKLCSFIAYEIDKIYSSNVDVTLEFQIGAIVFEMPGDKEVIYFTENGGKWSYYPYRE